MTRYGQGQSSMPPECPARDHQDPVGYRGAQGLTGGLLSFTGCLACCPARAVDDGKSDPAYPQGRGMPAAFRVMMSAPWPLLRLGISQQVPNSNGVLAGRLLLGAGFLPAECVCAWRPSPGRRYAFGDGRTEQGAYCCERGGERRRDPGGSQETAVAGGYLPLGGACPDPGTPPTVMRRCPVWLDASVRNSF